MIEMYVSPVMNHGINYTLGTVNIAVMENGPGLSRCISYWTWGYSIASCVSLPEINQAQLVHRISIVNIHQPYQLAWSDGFSIKNGIKASTDINLIYAEWDGNNLE